MICPNCVEKPYTFLESLFPGKEEYKKSFQGQYTCRKCETVLTFKKNKYGFMEFKSPFYVILSVILFVGVLLFWAAMVYVEDLFTFSSPAFSIAFLFVATLIISMGGGALARKYIKLEVYNPEAEENIEKKSTAGMVVFMVYAVFAIFGFAFLNDLANNHSVSPLIYVVGTLVYMGIVLFIAMKMMNSSLFKKEPK